MRNARDITNKSEVSSSMTMPQLLQALENFDGDTFQRLLTQYSALYTIAGALGLPDVANDIWGGHLERATRKLKLDLVRETAGKRPRD